MVYLLFQFPSGPTGTIFGIVSELIIPRQGSKLLAILLTWFTLEALKVEHGG